LGTIEEISKTQNLRLADVFVLAPVMVLSGYYIHKKSATSFEEFLALSIVGLGVGTAIFNGRNYVKQEKILIESKKAS